MLYYDDHFAMHKDIELLYPMSKNDVVNQPYFEK